MTSPPRLILLDLDGTLVGTDGTVSDRNAAALARGADAGARIVIATARPVRWLDDLRARVPASIAICSNGGVVIDLATHAVIRTHVLDGVRLLELVRRVRAGGAAIALSVEGLPEVGQVGEEHYPSPLPADLRHASLDEVGAIAAVKALIRGDPAHLETVRAVLDAEYADVLVHTRSSTDHLLEISMAGVSKGTVIEELATEWGIDAAEAIAFGDMPNDIQMMSWAGHSVAVANADPAVKAIATEVGAHCDDHAVARVLERWF